MDDVTEMCTVRALSETQEEATAEATLLAPIESSLSVSVTMAFLLKEGILNQAYILSYFLNIYYVGLYTWVQVPVSYNYSQRRSCCPKVFLSPSPTGSCQVRGEREEIEEDRLLISWES